MDCPSSVRNSFGLCVHVPEAVGIISQIILAVVAPGQRVLLQIREIIQVLKRLFDLFDKRFK